MQTFKANGKLLLTSEYVVLDGAKALCLPCKVGQNLEVSVNETSFIFWQALLSDGTVWFSAKLKLEKEGFKIISTTQEDKSIFLLKIFEGIKSLKPTLNFKGLSFVTKLEFPKDWGLGTSSTLIALLSKWAGINPYSLLEKTFGGSGYDIACAENNQPIFYTRNHTNPIIEKVNFLPEFHENLFFVYLNKKQNSREGIKMYKSLKKDSGLINELSNLSQNIIEVKTIEELNKLLLFHETLLSKYLGIKTIKQQLFPDYNNGVIKSLGAWGGDFVMASTTDKSLNYFKKKGYNNILKYKSLIK